MYFQYKKGWGNHSQKIKKWEGCCRAVLYFSQNLKRSALLSYDYLFYSVLPFCKKSFTCFPSKLILHSYTNFHWGTINTLHIYQLLERSPLGRDTSHQQDASRGHGVTSVQLRWGSPCSTMGRFTHPDTSVLKEHLTTVQRFRSYNRLHLLFWLLLKYELWGQEKIIDLYTETLWNKDHSK